MTHFPSAGKGKGKGKAPARDEDPVDAPADWAALRVTAECLLAWIIAMEKGESCELCGHPLPAEGASAAARTNIESGEAARSSARVVTVEDISDSDSEASLPGSDVYEFEDYDPGPVVAPTPATLVASTSEPATNASTLVALLAPALAALLSGAGSSGTQTALMQVLAQLPALDIAAPAPPPTPVPAAIAAAVAAPAPAPVAAPAPAPVAAPMPAAAVVAAPVPAAVVPAAVAAPVPAAPAVAGPPPGPILPAGAPVAGPANTPEIAEEDWPNYNGGPFGVHIGSGYRALNGFAPPPIAQPDDHGPFYVVTRGHAVGVFTSWVLTASTCVGVAGSVVNRVNSYHAALEKYQAASNAGFVRLV